MIRKIIEYSLQNRFLIVLLTLSLVGAGIWSAFHIRLDAIPDLSDVQVIVTTEYPGQNPQVVDDQVTYPIAAAMLAVPGSTVVRGVSMFEQSFVYVLFDEGTDIYWARSRVLEYLNFAKDRLPKGIEPKLGPDATGVGWVYQYALVSGDHDLGELRSIQDWYLRYPLTAVDGVAEVASFGGYVKQYQVVLDPLRLAAYKLSTNDIVEAIKKSNNDVGGSVLELSENEYMVRSRGYLQGIKDLELVVLARSERGAPVFLRDVATLQIGGEARRGIGELNGQGEAVGGVIVARFGANAYEVIQNVKKKLKELEAGLPPGVSIKTTYDRSALIERSVHTLRQTLLEEIIVVGLVCILFLLHARSELVAVFVVPASVIAAILLMNLLGINANIMSLGGIAIAIGVVVDSAIIMVENAHKHLDREEERLAAQEIPAPQGLTIAPARRLEIIRDAALEVGPQLFFCLLIITVSFLPVFMLEGEAGRLFKPLAFTKTFAMAAAAILSITIIPVLMYYFITSRVLPARWGQRRNLRVTLAAMFVPAALLIFVSSASTVLHPYRWWISIGWAVLAGMLLIPQRIIHEDKSPISNALKKLYEPLFLIAMRQPWRVMGVAALLLISTWYPLSQLGTEFMPPLDEGDLLYMPTTDPSISVTKSRELLQQTDKLIKSFPEVATVHGKVGRAETATDPAPLSMLETVIQLEPDKTKWRKNGSRPITTEELKFGWTDPEGQRHPGLNDIVKFPGVANSWPFPIANRITMLATGIKTPVGIKIMGADLAELSRLAEEAATAVRTVPGTVSAYPERSLGGYYLDIDVNQEDAARYGLTRGDVQDFIAQAIGGMNVTTTVEGLARFPLNIRVARELRDTPSALEELLVSAPDGLVVPLGQIAKIQITPGAPMIRSENAQRSAWVYVDVAGRDLGSYLADARAAIASHVNLPAGYQIVFSGQFEFWEKTVPRLLVAGALTIVGIIVLLYLSARSWFRVAVIMLALPFSMIGAVWLLYFMGYNMSLAVVIGMIALAGLDAETGMVMLLYLESSFERFKESGRLQTKDDLLRAIHDGAVMRIRPKAMTVSAAFVGLVPLLWAHGSGADVMRRLAVPMIGGLAVSFAMELVVYPVVFYLHKQKSL